MCGWLVAYYTAQVSSVHLPVYTFKFRTHLHRIDQNFGEACHEKVKVMPWFVLEVISDNVSYSSVNSSIP